MKSSQILGAIASACLAAGAYAVPLSKSKSRSGVSARQAPLVFSVSQFSAGATPHSSIGYISLTWSYTDPNTNTNSTTTTTCSARPATYQTLPSVAQTPCSDAATSFNLTQTPDADGSGAGAELTLWYEVAPDQFASGTHAIPADQIVWTNQQSPTGTVQVYAGPQVFSVEAVYA
ncbi:hypothetical protein F4778DRAFT_751030 [Xylariomycetidae sp. FL2044]|nr:hypothetical protein F4778DRAFT_751030 [Xylariomycetidae sp. FL2044]